MPYQYTVRTFNYICLSVHCRTFNSMCPTGTFYGPLILYALPVHCTDLRYLCHVDGSLIICPTGKLYGPFILYSQPVHWTDLWFLCYVSTLYETLILEALSVHRMYLYLHMPCRYSVRTFNSICTTGTLYGPLVLYTLTVHCTDLSFYMPCCSNVRNCDYVSCPYNIRTFNYIGPVVKP